MAFRPQNYEDGKTVLIPGAAAIAFTKGDACIDNGAGFLTTAGAGENTDILYVAAQTITTGAATGDMVLCWETGGVEFSADADAAIAQTDVGHAVDLAAGGTINPDAVVDQVFWLQRIDGTAWTSTVGIGYFGRGVPNS